MIRFGSTWFLDDQAPGYPALTNRILDAFQLSGSNNGGGRLLDAPGDGDLSHLHILLLGQILDANSTVNPRRCQET